RRKGHIRRYGGRGYPALRKKHIFFHLLFLFLLFVFTIESSVRHSNNFTYASPAAVALCEETTSERGGEALYIIASKIYFIDNVSPD
ncbi:hypothetical protein, partial [Segatella copri]|uniref:hypothetical protein n=1 Tax=Segatella copri TaxID=165179 RepID=UPI0022E15421